MLTVKFLYVGRYRYSEILSLSKHERVVFIYFYLIQKHRKRAEYVEEVTGRRICIHTVPIRIVRCLELNNIFISYTFVESSKIV